MATEARETLYRIFMALAGDDAPQRSDGIMSADAVLPEAGTGIVMAAANAATAAAATAGPTASGRAAGDSGSRSQQQGSDGGSMAETIAVDVLKSGFGLVPLVTALFGLIGGGDSPAPPALTKYVMPARRDFQAAETAAGLTDVDYDQSGMPRPADRGAAGWAPQIQVNVQAMDARSFLDRSSEIASAVREAMLHLNAINDVVNDL